MLAEVVGYLDEVGLGSAHVVGYSDGGILALMLAVAHPGRVRSMVAISASLAPDVTVPEDYPHVTTPQAALDRLRREYDELSPDGPEHADGLLERLVHLWQTAPDIPVADLTRIAAPTLVMAGEHDVVDRAHTRLIADTIPGARLTVVPGTTHMLVAEQPEVVARHVLDFLG